MNISPLQPLLHSEWNHAFAWEPFVRYSVKNVDKMRENFEKTEVSEAVAGEIKGLTSEVRVLVIGADWCGDAVANVPSIARLATLSDKVQLRVLDRDRHDELMGHFLTNGGKAVPKAIIAAADFSKFVVWGPRPAACQQIMTDNKDKMPKEEIYPMIRAWYEQDKNQTLLGEIVGGIREITSA